MNAKSIRVRDFMNKDVKFIDKNTSIISAGKQMIDENVSSFIGNPFKYAILLSVSKTTLIFL